MSAALDRLVDLLNLEVIEENIFRGQHPAEARQRTFGGQVAAQALMAAGRTVPHGRVHSLHSYFLRPGDSTTPILYEVDRIRDGRSFTTRRVVAIQHGRAIFNMQASFHDHEVGPEHQQPMPDVPGPEHLPSIRDHLGEDNDLTRWFVEGHPFDQRFIDGGDRAAVERLWFRADGQLPDDPLLHAGIVTYASDMTIYGSIIAPHDVRWDDGTFMAASLDHCMWFHHELRADDWLYFDADSPIAHGARGLGHGSMYTEKGTLVVSLMQEGLVRPLGK